MTIKKGEEILNPGHKMEGLLYSQKQGGKNIVMEVINEDTLLCNDLILISKDNINKRPFFSGENPGCTSLIVNRSFLQIKWEPTKNDFGRRK